MGPLKEPSVNCQFRAWVEDSEMEVRKKNDCVVDAQLLQKYKELVFSDPDTGRVFYIAEEICEYHKYGKDMGWYLIAVDVNDPEEENNEAFSLEIACDLIGDYLQKEGIMVVHQEME